MVHVEEQAAALAAAIEAALPGWVERSVERLVTAYAGPAAAVEARPAARRAGLEALADVGPSARALLEADADRQRDTPLNLLRQAVRYPTAVLRDLGVPPVVRDEFAQAQFPDDDYDLTPASFADISPELAGPGLAWGAAKAWAHLQRHPPQAPPP